MRPAPDPVATGPSDDRPPGFDGGIVVGSTFHRSEERQRKEVTLEADLLSNANERAAGPVVQSEVRQQWSRVVGQSGLIVIDRTQFERRRAGGGNDLGLPRRRHRLVVVRDHHRPVADG